jgi:hypothetical protein
MSKTQTGKRNPAALFALILAGETIFFLPFVLARVFRPTLLAVFQISNFELGAYFLGLRYCCGGVLLFWRPIG